MSNIFKETIEEMEDAINYLTFIDDYELYEEYLLKAEQKFREFSALFPRLKNKKEYKRVVSQFNKKGIIDIIKRVDKRKIRNLVSDIGVLIGEAKREHSHLWEEPSDDSIETRLDGVKELHLQAVHCPYCSGRIEIPKTGFFTTCDSCGRRIYLRARE